MIRFFKVPLFILVFATVGLAADSLQQQLFQPDKALIVQMQNAPAASALNMPTNQTIEKSKGKAFFFSLIVPGMGQRYAGKRLRSEIYLATELTLWLSYTGLIQYREWRKQDFKAFAAAHAGVDLNGKSESYFIDVENYASIYEYNAAKLRQRNLNKYYRDVEGFYWQWDSESNRQKYEQLRISADTADNRALFVIGAILANHVISAIDAVWTVHKVNKARQSSVNWDVQFGDGYMQPTVLVSMSKQF